MRTKNPSIFAYLFFNSSTGCQPEGVSRTSIGARGPPAGQSHFRSRTHNPPGSGRNYAYSRIRLTMYGIDRFSLCIHKETIDNALENNFPQNLRLEFVLYTIYFFTVYQNVNLNFTRIFL